MARIWPVKIIKAGGEAPASAVHLSRCNVHFSGRFADYGIIAISRGGM